jgi:hypothetical protein
MADLCAPYSIAGITINNATAGVDRLLTSFENGQITGLDGAPVRSQVDLLAVTNGGIVHTKYYAPRIITFAGEVHIQSVTEAMTTAYITAINTLEAAVISALEGILNTPSTLSWTPTGLSARSISVTYGVPGQEIQFSGPMLPGERTFAFSLVAASPTIS